MISRGPMILPGRVIARSGGADDFVSPASGAAPGWALHRWPCVPAGLDTAAVLLARTGEASAVQVEFHFDFGSPNAYLAHRVVPAIEARTGAQFRYVPVLLGGIFKATGNRSPREAFAGIRNKPEYERLETERFIRRHGIEGFVRNPFFPVNTLQMMRGAVAADVDGELERYVNAMFHHMWEAPKRMDEPDVLRDALTASGFDADAMLARMRDPAVKATLIANTEVSVARGAFGSPTFFLGDAIYFGKDRLRDVEEAVLGIA
jgi:2-hydroxychromene-2-carboxylate isomerase